jgi:hypothetical protein
MKIVTYKDGKIQVFQDDILLEYSNNPIENIHEATQDVKVKSKKDINNLTKQGKLVKIK